ncbi:hypothetical protein QWY75_10620 [Pontixanthobacter aestiaquae]|uniref:Uncharacterized protein n=1 Tax=Pontixanthobacter aestiaquae TaxID=1509367 RepID=A0A844Z4D9_9SPHN|nr:hypothetical protein [Pontixanthobacter aestiaquae]MDN3646652.1 hypothetical protein [Pontixanthobacter aestiaquae]MXO82364.1 hypothetical protein [Pontixanthobacter aestiaquae]
MALALAEGNAASSRIDIKLSPDAVTAILDAVEKDGVDSAELYFLTELAGSSIIALRIRTADDTDTAYRDMPGLARLWGDDADPVRETIDAAYGKLWGEGVGGYEALLKHHSIGETQAEDLKKFAVSQMLDAEWDKSKVQNAYKPIRDTISGLFGHNNTLGEDEQRAGRFMVHSWFVALDNRHGDAVPDFLYAWMRPKD